MAVEWRPIPGFEAYEVNHYGYVRNAANRRRLMRFESGKRLNVRLTIRTGHPKGQTFGVGVAVLSAFVGPRPGPNYDCSHLDGDLWNNHLSNLAWETKSQNTLRKVEHGTMVRGERHHQAKLTAPQVLEIRRRVAAGATKASLAREFGVSQPAIRHIHVRRNWAHLPEEIHVQPSDPLAEPAQGAGGTDPPLLSA